MSTLFVTGSGTDVGKTFVTTLLIEALRAAGVRVGALKPVATGFSAEDLAASDTGRLLDALGLSPTADNTAAVSPWRYREPLSPDMAAARERRPIAFDELVAHCRASTGAEVTLIEGIGGAMVPLDDSHTVLDWIAALGAPALLVAGSYLGTLSHTLTAVAALRARGVPLAAVVISESERQPVPPEETAEVVRRFVRPVPVVLVPRRSAASGLAPPPDLLRALEPHLHLEKKSAGMR